MSGRQRVVLHVGLPKTGTTHLQATLARHRDVLATRGVAYPDLGPEAMFRGAVEVRGSHEAFGLGAAEVAGRWAALCAYAREHDGTTLISHEVLSGASEEEIARALEPLTGLEVDVVITARDLGRVATAYWQERVKLGEPWTFAALAEEQIEPELRGERPEPRSRFWHAYDLAETVRRWSTAADRVRVVAAPAPGVPEDELWRRFGRAADIEPATADLGPAPAGRGSNASLGRTQVALLREVDAALGDRLTRRERALVVKRLFAERVLPGLGEPEPALTPAGLAEPFAEATRRWLDEIAELGATMVGDPDDLAPRCGGPGDPAPDDVDPDRLVELATSAVAALALSGPPAGREAPSAPAAARTRMGRLRRAVGRLRPGRH